MEYPDQWEYQASNKSTLSKYACCALGGYWFKAVLQLYREEAGLNWQSTSYDERYAATTATSHEQTMLRELEAVDAYIEEFDERMIADIRQDNILGWLHDWLNEYEVTYFRLGLKRDYLISTLNNKYEQKKGEVYFNHLYSTYRRRPGAIPVPYLVWTTVHGMVRHGFVESCRRRNDRKEPRASKQVRRFVIN